MRLCVFVCHRTGGNWSNNLTTSFPDAVGPDSKASVVHFLERAARCSDCIDLLACRGEAVNATGATSHFLRVLRTFPRPPADSLEKQRQISGSEQSVIFSNYWFTFLSENSQHAVSALWHFGGVQPTDGSGEIHRSRPAMTMNCPAEPGNGTCLVASLRKAEACRAHFTSTFSCPSTNLDGIKGSAFRKCFLSPNCTNTHPHSGPCCWSRSSSRRLPDASKIGNFGMGTARWVPYA